ncbi:DotA/TraY family protein [Marinobacterium stanieri]|uniref:DotA/TraY family protein n=1 Tax=Marinobacterium stanieri TaxID=49186 RepID=UPI00158F1A73|nr:DotA/TraY family protein [Marinobacterium stanieri]
MTLLICSIEPSFAADSGQDKLDSSYAVQIYRAIFGGVTYYSVLEAPPEGMDSALAAMSLVFNLGVLVVLSNLLLIMIVGKLISSGNDGEIMSKRYNDTMAVTRGSMSFVGLTPVANGFSLAQVMVMFFAINASFLADQVNEAGNKHIYSTGSVSTFRPDAIAINTLVESMVAPVACSIASNYYYSEHPKFDSYYKISMVDKNITAEDDAVAFQYNFQNAKGLPVCGSVSMEIGSNKYFGDLGDPTGTFSEMTSYQLEVRQLIFDAHRYAVVETYNKMTSIFSPGHFITGAEIDSYGISHSLDLIKKYYRSKLYAGFESGSQKLADAWDQLQNNEETNNSLSLSAQHGWVYTGLTWMDKSRIESFMAKLSRSIPRASAPDYKLMEGGFVEDQWNKSQTLIKDSFTIANSTTGLQKNFKKDPGDVNISLEQLTNDLTANDSVEQALANFSGFLLKDVLVSSQFNFEDYDPITNLQHLGLRMVNTGWLMIFSSTFMQATVDGFKEGTDANIVAKVADWISMGTISGAKAFGHSIISSVLGHLMTMGGVLVAVGSVLGYWLPSLPFFMWTLAVMGNFVLVMIAFLAAPMHWAANSLPGGDGFSNDHARQGWITLLTILARPSIMVMTWHLSLLLMREMGNFASGYLYYVPMMQAESFVAIWGTFVTFIIFIVIQWVICNRCISLVYEIPDQIPLYYGAQQTMANESIGENRGQGVVAGWSHQTQQHLTGASKLGGTDSLQKKDKNNNDF